MRRNSATLTAHQRRFGLIDRCEYFQPPPLALFPERHGFPHSVFLAAQPAGLNSLADERVLVGRQMHLHTPLSLGAGKATVKPGDVEDESQRARLSVRNRAARVSKRSLRSPRRGANSQEIFGYL